MWPVAVYAFAFSLLLIGNALTPAICCLLNYVSVSERHCIACIRHYGRYTLPCTSILWFVQLFSFSRLAACCFLHVLRLDFLCCHCWVFNISFAFNCSHCFFLPSSLVDFLVVSRLAASLFHAFRIRSQIWQWPFHAMFISCNNEILFSAIFSFFRFMFRKYFFHCHLFLFVLFNFFSFQLRPYDYKPSLIWLLLLFLHCLSAFSPLRSRVGVSSHDVSFIVYVVSSKFRWKSTKAHFR